MRVLVKNIPCKNFTARLSGSRGNGRCRSTAKIVKESSQDPIESQAVESINNKHAIDSGIEQTQTFSLPPLRESVSNFKQKVLSWPLPEVQDSVKRKFSLNLPIRSLSHSSLAWNNKSFKDVKASTQFDPNYSYPYLSKIFGTEDLLMRSDAYNQALFEATRRRAALKTCNAARKELKNDVSKRPQVINIKGWGASRKHKAISLESKLRTSNPSLPPTKNTKQVDIDYTKEVTKLSFELWNADKSNLTYRLKSNIEATKSCPRPRNTQKQFETSGIKDAHFKTSHLQNGAHLKVEIIPGCSKSWLKTIETLKPAKEDMKKDDVCKPSYIRRSTKSNSQPEIKTNSLPSSEKSFVRAHEVIKQDMTSKSSYLKSGTKSNTQLELKAKPRLTTETPIRVIKKDDISKPSYLRKGTPSNAKPVSSQTGLTTQSTFHIKKNCFCHPTNLWIATKSNAQYRLKSETQSVKTFAESIKVVKTAEEGLKNDNLSKSLEQSNASQTNKLPETQSSRSCLTPANLDKHTDGDCKINDSYKPCKPADPVKEELAKIDTKEEVKEKTFKNLTGCVDDKCKKDDKCKTPPRSPSKLTSTLKRSRMRSSESLKAVKRMRGCENKVKEKSTKPNCPDYIWKEISAKNKSSCDDSKLGAQKITDSEKKSLCGGSKTDTQKKTDSEKKQIISGESKNDAQKRIDSGMEKCPCGGSKTDAQAKADSAKEKSSCSGNKLDVLSKTNCVMGNNSKGGSKTDYQIKTVSEKEKSPCSRSKIEGHKNNDPCKKEHSESSPQKENTLGSKNVEPCKDKKHSPCGSRKEKPTKAPCNKDQKKENTCISSAKSDGSKKNKDLNKPMSEENNPCRSNKQKENTYKTPETSNESNKQNEGTCGNNKQAGSTCGEDPCKSFRVKDKKSSSCSSFKQETTSAEKKEESACKPKIPAIQDIGKLIGDTMPNCVKVKESLNTGCSQKNHIKENCNATASTDNNESRRPIFPKMNTIRNFEKITIKTELNRRSIKESSGLCGNIKGEAKKDTASAEKNDRPIPCKPIIPTSQNQGKLYGNTNSKCSNVRKSSSPCGSRKETPIQDPCKAAASAEKKLSTGSVANETPSTRNCAKPNREIKPNCVNTKESSSGFGSNKTEPQKDSCKTAGSAEKTKPTNPCKPKITANQDQEKPSTDTNPKCSSVRKSSSPCGSRKADPIPDPCKSAASAEKEHSTITVATETPSTRNCERPRRETKPNCVNTKESSSGFGSNKTEPQKNSCKTAGSAEKTEPTNPCKPKITANQDQGKPNADTNPKFSNVRKSSSPCGSRKEDPIQNPCKSAASAEKKQSASSVATETPSTRNCERPRRETKPNCVNTKESSSGFGSNKTEPQKNSCKTAGSAEKTEPTNPCKPKITANQDQGKPNADTNPKFSNVRKSSSPCGSRKEDPIQNPCKSAASAEKKEVSSASNQNCGKPKRDTKPNCSSMSKSFSTFTINAKNSFSTMIKRGFATLTAIPKNSFVRYYASKSGDKNKKGQREIGRASQCKSVGTSIPSKRKPAFNPHPNETLRQCYPTYDMDCTKLCKDARKTNCKKYAFLEETNTNKRKGHK